MKACKGTVVITGASSGFGQAAAKRFASEGYRLVLMARRLERLTDLAFTLEEDAPCHVVELDVRDSNAVSEAFATLPEPFHQPDILINNAGLALGLSGADAVDLDDWETMVDTNIKGLMYVRVPACR